ncbi:MAG: class I SAM-dependent methyltransferase [Cyclobacteriaceae bacterium]|nr:class I SAM-dependent methyltransferase [Cyclobacteriaceae bacterium]
MSEFDAKAATWDENPDRVERALEIAKYLKKHIDISNVNKALEYGSGTGLLSFALQDALPDITLMDGSIEMTKVAQQKVGAHGVTHLHPIHYDLMEQPLPEERYDLIFILLTLHHIDDTKGFIERAFHLLNQGGQLVIIDLEKEDGSFHDGPFHGHKGFERSELEGQLKTEGFSTKHSGICWQIEKEKEGHKKKFPLFMMAAQK